MASLELAKMKLTVHEALKEDVYRDLVRVPEVHRKDMEGRTIAEAEVRRIRIGSRTAFVVLRGWKDTSEATIRLDERTRNLLGVDLGENLEFSFESAWFGGLRWAWNSTDIAYRTMAKLALLSVLLSLFGGILGVIGLILGLRASCWR